LRKEDEGKEVVIAGWIRKIRDHGELIFIDLWDRYGLTQVVIPSEEKGLQIEARKLGLQWVIRVKEVVRRRPEGMENKALATGDIEIICKEIEVLNPSEIPPFVVEKDVKALEDLRLTYRYLDLRRWKMQKNFIIRHRVIQKIMDCLSQRDFLEIETPILAKSTPEGSRDFLVPSRLKPGTFYALAQSPQLYKQILMVTGFDKYFQFARCFRDENLRGDRQPEHTQIDIEASFVDEEDIFTLTEGMMREIFQIIGVDIEVPFERITYRDAMERFGTDKPHLRIPLEIEDYTTIAKSGDFRIFKKADVIKGLKIKGKFSRKEITEMEEVVKR